jgi:hypothetical protein
VRVSVAVDLVCAAIKERELTGYRAALYRGVYGPGGLAVDLVGLDRWAVLDLATRRGVEEGWLGVADMGEPFYTRSGSSWV